MVSSRFGKLTLEGIGFLHSGIGFYTFRRATDLRTTLGPVLSAAWFSVLHY